MLPLHTELSVPLWSPSFSTKPQHFRCSFQKKLKSMHCILLFDLFNQLNFCKKSRKSLRGGGDEAKLKINTVSRYQTNYLTSQTIILGKQGIHLDTLITTRTLCTKYTTESWMKEKKNQNPSNPQILEAFIICRPAI